MNAKRDIFWGRTIALISFALGTILIIWFFISEAPYIPFIGMYYVLGAFLINLFVVKLILFKASYDKANRKELLKTISLMLLNIPIALFYCWIVIAFLNTLRIKFTNQTKGIITEIKIEGCQQKYIPRLKQGESKTLWIGIKGDCHVKMEYQVDGERQTATVVGYTTNLQGKKMEHIINDKPVNN